MAPARASKSRKLKLEDGPGGGKGNTVSESASSPSEKKLYVFVWHDLSDDYDYSLFALDIPSPGTRVKTKPTVFTTPWVKAEPKTEPQRSPVRPKTEPERSPVCPVLRFGHDENWPRSMRCIRLGDKLYFLGGYHDGEEEDPRQVYVLDLSKEIKRRDAKNVLEEVAPMNAGKGDLFASFVSDGKIFVVSGRRGVQFEIFDPSEGVWNKDGLLQPPFGDDAYLYPPLVVDRTVFFGGEGCVGDKFTCCYSIDTGIWSDYSVMTPDPFNYRCVMRGDGFNYCGRRRPRCDGDGCFHCTAEVMDLMFRGVPVGDKMWNVRVDPETKVPAIVRLNITMGMAMRMGNKREVKKFSSGLRYYIQHPLDADDLFYPPPGTLLTRAAAQDSRLCFLQVESRGGLAVGLLRMSAILFDVHQGSSKPPKYLTSAHYFVKGDSARLPYDLIDAHLV